MLPNQDPKSNKSVFQEYYHVGKMRCPPSVSVSELREACDYLLVPFNAQTVQCHNLRSFLHELSNEGARQQFTAFLEEIILPQMIVSTEVNSFNSDYLFFLLKKKSGGSSIKNGSTHYLLGETKELIFGLSD